MSKSQEKREIPHFADSVRNDEVGVFPQAVKTGHHTAAASLASEGNFPSTGDFGRLVGRSALGKILDNFPVAVINSATRYCCETLEHLDRRGFRRHENAERVLLEYGLKIPSLILLFLLTLGSVSAHAQEGEAEQPTLTLEQALALAQQDNRQIKISKQSELAANDQILAVKTQRYPQFNVQLTGGALLTPVSVEFNRGVFGTSGGNLVPSENSVVTTDPKLTGMAVIQAYQPLSQLYNIRLNIEALQVGKKLAEEQTRQQRQQIVNTVKDVYYSLLQSQSALDAAEESVKSYREIDRTTDEYVKVKSVLVYQSTGVKTQLAQAELQVVTLQDTLDSQKENLNVLLGRDVRMKFRPSTLPEELPEELDLEAARQKAMDNRTEVRQAKLKLDQAVYSRRIEKSQYIPEVGIQYLFFSPFSIQGLPSSINSIGIQLQVGFVRLGL